MMDRFYKTISFGGMEGYTKEEELFVDEATARAAALANNWNTNYVLYQVDMVITKGKMIMVDTCIGEIEGGRKVIHF